MTTSLPSLLCLYVLWINTHYCRAIHLVCVSSGRGSGVFSIAPRLLPNGRMKGALRAETQCIANGLFILVYSCQIICQSRPFNPTLTVMILGNWNDIFVFSTISQHWDSSCIWNPSNSLRPSDAIWRQKTGSTLAQVMACCLTAPLPDPVLIYNQ